MSLLRTQKIAYSGEWETFRYGQFTAGRNIGNIVIAQPGLWATVEDSFFIQSLREKVVSGANFSLFAVDHPCYGLNERPYLGDLTLPACVANTQKAVKYILDLRSTKKVIWAGNSIGYLSLFNAVCENNNDPRILGILGKSGISSYQTILGRMLMQFWNKGDYWAAWNKLFKHFNIDKATWNCTIEVNAWEPVTIHENFIFSCITPRESRTTLLPVECWQGENDTYTSPSEMQEHNWGNIIVHVQKGVWHNLSTWPNDTTPARVHAEMVLRMGEIFWESGN